MISKMQIDNRIPARRSIIEKGPVPKALCLKRTGPKGHYVEKRLAQGPLRLKKYCFGTYRPFLGQMGYSAIQIFGRMPFLAK
jgi:hypothetical protein